MGLKASEVAQGFGRRELGDQNRVALLQVPEVVQIAVGEDDEADVLRTGVLAGLLLADQRVELLRLRLQDGDRKAAFVQQEIIHVAVGGLLEVVAEVVEGRSS